jgi:pSer/pThr/pTyr-binding forkhead associated (FHA) protein
MGAIRESSTGEIRILEPSHVIGRVPAPRCSLTLDEPYVSGVHAELRWTGAAWEVKDLGSRNGTYLDGRRLDPSASHRIGKGSKIAFGKREREWEMIDESSPSVMAVPLSGGDPVLLRDDFIALPSSDDPRATIYRTIEGVWVLETPDAAPRTLADQCTFEAVGRLWRFCCSDMPPATLATDDVAARMELADLDVIFSVSRDEEHVHLAMRHAGRAIDMGTRKHNYLLLTLARRRLSECAQGLPETSCGWIDQEELAHDPSMAPPQLNIDVFRIREQFSKAGVMDAAGIIQRRPGQLRFGTSRVSITTL